MRIVEIPDDGIVRRPIMNGEDTVGEMRVDLSYLPILKDVAPIIHAKWILAKYASEWTCSNCDGEMLYQITTYGGGQYHDIDNIHPPYCPHCGAKMDLED